MLFAFPTMKVNAYRFLKVSSFFVQQKTFTKVWNQLSVSEYKFWANYLFNIVLTEVPWNSDYVNLINI